MRGKRREEARVASGPDADCHIGEG
jgi:hypothetical protein